MPTVVFDFDSTLIDCESLDEILSRIAPERAGEIRAVTRQGMEGRIPFVVSLRRRLAVAQPKLGQVLEYAQSAVDRLTPGMEELIGRLDAEVWIVSGALYEAVLGVADRLGIPEERILCTRPRWGFGCGLLGLELCGEKVDLVRALAPAWPRPRIAVGDGMSDHALLAEGCVDHFIAFTAHVRRAAVVATGAPEARSVRELEYLLANLT